MLSRAVEIDRVEAVRILLSTRTDYLLIAGMSRLGAIPGPAPGRTIPCGVCMRRGRVVQAGRRRLCPLCEGRGWRRRRPGEAAWDEYIGEPVESADAGGDKEPPAAPSKRPKKATGPSQQERFDADAARVRHWRSGSYEELERALESLRSIAPELHEIVLDAHGAGNVLSDDLRSILAHAESALAAMMRGPVFVPSEAVEGAWRVRNQRVSKRIRAGATVGDAARAEGSGYQSARRIARRSL